MAMANESTKDTIATKQRGWIKGPWRLTQEAWESKEGYCAPDVFSDADPDNPKIVCTMAVRVNWEANGNLIAAAPDLYAALAAMLQDAIDRSTEVPSKTYDAACNALAKARGKARLEQSND